MSSDQVARLAATIEVLTSAVQFLIAERINQQPEDLRSDLLRVLQRSLSTPSRRDDAFSGKAALTQADLAMWMPIIATGMMDDVRAQLGLPPEPAPHLGRG
ncbi:hypothetical protein [Methylobacterium sp. A54F]